MLVSAAAAPVVLRYLQVRPRSRNASKLSRHLKMAAIYCIGSGFQLGGAQVR